MIKSEKQKDFISSFVQVVPSLVCQQDQFWKKEKGDDTKFKVKSRATLILLFYSLYTPKYPFDIHNQAERYKLKDLLDLTRLLTNLD